FPTPSVGKNWRTCHANGTGSPLPALFNLKSCTADGDEVARQNFDRCCHRVAVFGRSVAAVEIFKPAAIVVEMNLGMVPRDEHVVLQAELVVLVSPYADFIPLNVMPLAGLHL